MIEVYAVTDRVDAELPAGRGLARVTHGEMAGIYSPLKAQREGATPEALWRHESLVESLMEDRAVLPLRYGTVLPGERELEKLLADRSEEFSRLLDAVRGRVEVALRVLREEGKPTPARESSSGREYLEALARHRRRADEAAALLEPLERMANAVRKRKSSADDATRWSFLVDRGRLDDFTALL